MPLVGSEVFGGVAADQPGETGEDGSKDNFDYSDHEWLLWFGSVTIL